jgi:beta-lactamase regulating signal transducer with metallopeptidase domain
VSAVVSWLATYLLHSTVLLVSALIASRFVRNDAWRDTLWKAALLGGLATASLPGLLHFEPAAGAWTSVDEWAQRAAISAAPTPAEPSAESAPSRESPANTAADTVPTERRSLFPWLVGLWLGGGAVLLGRLVVDHARLYRALAERKPLEQAVAAAMVARFRRHAGHWERIRLSTSTACPTPIALGLREICLPERFSSDLKRDEQEAALAHEFAHLVRRDPLWQLIAGITEAVFFFQPLHKVARRHMRESAEHLADDWAVRMTGTPLGLARCLTEVSSWIGTARIPKRTLAMAEGGSSLLDRVERLTAWQERPLPGAGVRTATALAALAALGVVAPVAVSGGSRLGLHVPESQGELGAAIPDTVIRHADPSVPLADRWRWATDRTTDRSWIAWATESDVMPGVKIASNSGQTVAGPRTLFNRLVPELEGQTGLAIVAFGFRDAGADDPTAIRLRAVDDSVALPGTLLWLGSADAASSLHLLLRLHGSASRPAVRAEIAAAMAIHDDRDLVPGAIQSLLDSETEASVRSEAVQWLARNPTPATVRLVAHVAWSDPASSVRAEAVDALASMLESGIPGADEALNRVAEDHSELNLRSEAIQALAARANGEAGS